MGKSVARVLAEATPHEAHLPYLTALRRVANDQDVGWLQRYAARIPDSGLGVRSPVPAEIDAIITQARTRPVP